MHRELLQLYDDDSVDLRRLLPEQILLKWVNFHLKKAGVAKEMTNFGEDMKGGTNVLHLLYQLSPDVCNLNALNGTTEEKVQSALEMAKAFGNEFFLSATSLNKGVSKMNLLYLASVFDVKHGLVMEAESHEKFSELIQDAEGSREERAFCSWMTSLGVAVRNIVEDLRDGVKLLQVMDIISPGIVDWKKVNMNPKNTYTQTENTNYVVLLGKKLNFSMVGIAGKDFVDGNRKLMLALIWQMMKLHVFSILSKINRFGAEPTQEDIVNWTNQKVKNSGKDIQMKDCKDSTLSSGRFLIDLLNAIRPRVVDYSLVTHGSSDEDKMLNAKYAISVARKIGCCIFLLWEDIVEVNPKMILTFVATLMSVVY